MKKEKLYFYIGVLTLQIGASMIHRGLGVLLLGLWCLLFSYCSFVEREEEKQKYVILLSSHLRVACLLPEEIVKLGSFAANPKAEDLIKVTCADGKVYWCDSLVVTDDINYEG